eukprot:4107424-Amphidinium_carterae.1
MLHLCGRKALKGSRVSYGGTIVDHAHYLLLNCQPEQTIPALLVLGIGGGVPLVDYIFCVDFPSSKKGGPDCVTLADVDVL